MNSINSIRLDLNTARYNSASARNRVSSVEGIKDSTQAETEKRKQSNTQLVSEYDSETSVRQEHKPFIINNNDSKLYRASLLYEIVNEMSGLGNRPSPGQYVEYYA